MPEAKPITLRTIAEMIYLLGYLIFWKVSKEDWGARDEWNRYAEDLGLRKKG